MKGSRITRWQTGLDPRRESRHGRFPTVRERCPLAGGLFLRVQQPASEPGPLNRRGQPNYNQASDRCNVGLLTWWSLLAEGREGADGRPVFAGSQSGRCLGEGRRGTESTKADSLQRPQGTEEGGSKRKTRSLARVRM